MKELVEIARKAVSNKCHCYECVYDGFKFSVVYRPNDSLLQAGIAYEPGWPHMNYVYAKGVEELIEALKAKIAEDKKIWKNGGHYSK